MNHSKRILPIIIFSQFCCTSLWFAGNGVMDDLILSFQLQESALGHLTSAVQFGFISGTFIFALLSIADRFSPSKVFFLSAAAGAIFNVAMVLESNGFLSLLIFRFLTGFFLAGIYPIGMKIAADYYESGLGKSLSYLVGALVLGSAFPHFLKGFTEEVGWEAVLYSTSVLSVFGGLLILLVPNGPFRKASQKIDLTALFKVFKNGEFKAAAFGYFGHMWELYAFWAFIPVMLASYSSLHPDSNFNIPLLTFMIIGIGGLACAPFGIMAQKIGNKKTAIFALSLSGICCLVSPLFFLIDSPTLFVGFLLFWGIVVIVDSPLFSTLVAKNAEPKLKGTALTIVNCVGFSITIVSIQLLTALRDVINPTFMFALLALGPAFGLMALYRKNEKTTDI
ncbi:MAG: MFS transporter [Balneolaceae bacterium]